jgi:hypothetical protein
MTTHKHLEEIDPSTLSPTELRERLTWRDEHPAEVIRLTNPAAVEQDSPCKPLGVAAGHPLR